jgi:hypothetical protein
VGPPRRAPLPLRALRSERIVTPRGKPMTSAELIDSAVNPLPLRVGARLVSVDPEDPGLRGTVLAIANDGYIKTRWDDGGESWHTAKNVRVIDDGKPLVPARDDGYVDYIEALRSLADNPPFCHAEARENAITEAQALLHRAIEILGGAK